MEEFKENKKEEFNSENKINLGFERKEGTVGIFQITLDSQKIGTFTLFDPEEINRNSEVKVKQIGYVRFDDTVRGKGIGKKFYIELNSYLQNLDGSFLESGDDTTIFADRVWESLFKDGLVTKSVGLDGKDSYRFYNKNDIA